LMTMLGDFYQETIDRVVNVCESATSGLPPSGGQASALLDELIAQRRLCQSDTPPSIIVSDDIYSRCQQDLLAAGFVSLAARSVTVDGLDENIVLGHLR